MENTVFLWAGFHLVVFFILGVDLGLLRRGSHTVSPREAVLWTSLWVTLSLLLCAGIYVVAGRELALQFLSGYLVEYSLSVDNLFVFLMLFQYFRVPPEFRHRLLFWGIIGQFAMRAPLLIAGAALVSEFHWILYIFGAFLLYTAWRMFFSDNAGEIDPSKSVTLAAMRRVLRVSEDTPRGEFFIRQEGRIRPTPNLVTLMFINIVDLVFALDSIPAVIGVVTSGNTFIVYSSNVCALLGLRSLFFVVAAMMDKFRYVKTGVALILAFVGTKMMVAHWIQISNTGSLAIVAAILAACIAASALIKPSTK